MIWLEILKIVLAGGLLGYVVGMLIVKRPYYINKVRPKFWMRIAKKMDVEDWVMLICASFVFTVLTYFVLMYSADFISRFWTLYSQEYVFSQIEAVSPLLLLIMATLIPVIEEWVFRGIIQEELSRRLRSRAAGLVLTAAIFALFHLSNPGTYPAAVFPLFLGGIMFGICYTRTTGLAGAILTHAAYNFILVLPAVLGI